ncbi:hypothetical protein GR212_12005 [Rhizobium lusitanum]|uniref:Uncharacterized protein n=1 Tax=Rhizobium lusitanum TaxID=293958 RepID=A0A6L9U7Z0_9HYPH|nr:hypothetical protein [Rhizobium lusitanum]
MTIATPGASLFPRLSIIKIDSRAMLAVKSLVRKIVTADADILAKTHFTGCGGRNHCSKNDEHKHGHGKQPPGGNEAK